MDIKSTTAHHVLVKDTCLFQVIYEEKIFIYKKIGALLVIGRGVNERLDVIGFEKMMFDRFESPM